MNPSRLNLSVVVITLNEERRLTACLKSLPSGAEIIVVDSGSTDRTVQIAEEFGAQVSARSFDNYANQKNAAVSLATRDWVFSIDADEELDDSARQRIIDVVQAQPQTSAFTVTRELFFLGRHLRFGKTQDAPLRLWPRGQGQFVGEVHEHVQTSLNIRNLGSAHLWHYSYDDLTDYFKRFNLYTTKVAQKHFHEGHRAPPLLVICLRPWVEFLNRYFLRLGILDGYPGFVYALCSSMYTFVKYAKLREIEAGESN